MTDQTDVFGLQPPAAAVPAPAADPFAAPPAPSPVTFRRFDDPDAIRKGIFDGVLSAVRTKYPIENARYRLELENLAYDKPKDFLPADEKKAILQGQNLEWRLKGDWVLRDKASGKEVERKSSVIAHVPWLTRRNTFVIGGTEHALAHQMRLRPGVYVRRKASGEIEGHVNVKPGTGPGFRVYLEPDTGVFRLGLGQSTLKLYPILKAMGADDKTLEEHWGRELLDRNREAEDPRAVQRAFSRLLGDLHEETVEARAKEEVWTEEAGSEKAAADRKPAAVVIRGNPKRLDGRQAADGFYGRLAGHLQSRGYEVSFDPGEPFTEPPAADGRVGHSRGADRLRFAPEGTRTVALGSGLPDAVNHPDDKAAAGGEVGDAHFTPDDGMLRAIDERLGTAGKSAAERVRFLLPADPEHRTYLMQAATSSQFAGKRRFPGGKTDPGGTPVHTAVREPEEEPGLDVKPAALEHLGRMERKEFAPGDNVEHCFRLAGHGVKPGRYQASDDSNEIVDPAPVAPDDPGYLAPPIADILAVKAGRQAAAGSGSDEAADRRDHGPATPMLDAHHREEYGVPAGRLDRSVFLYDEPDASADKDAFAHCGSCALWRGPEKTRCAIMDSDGVEAGHSCGLWVAGDPPYRGPDLPKLPPDRVGYVRHRVQCRRCAFYSPEEGGHCGLFERLTAQFPDVFSLGERVSPHGCCTAHTPSKGGTKRAEEDLYPGTEGILEAAVRALEEAERLRKVKETARRVIAPRRGGRPVAPTETARPAEPSSATETEPPFDGSPSR